LFKKESAITNLEINMLQRFKHQRNHALIIEDIQQPPALGKSSENVLKKTVFFPKLSQNEYFLSKWHNYISILTKKIILIFFWRENTVFVPNKIPYFSQ